MIRINSSTDDDTISISEDHRTTSISDSLQASLDVMTSTLLTSNMTMVDSAQYPYNNCGTITIGSGTGGNLYNTGTYGTGITGIYTTGVDNIYIGNRQLNVQGDAEISGKLLVNGKDIGRTLEKIEQRLGILKVSPELESRWERLRELGDQYRELEKEILGQEEIYDILKR